VTFKEALVQEYLKLTPEGRDDHYYAIHEANERYRKIQDPRTVLEQIEALQKALADGGYDMAPENLMQGCGYDIPTYVVELLHLVEKLQAENTALRDQAEEHGQCSYCKMDMFIEGCAKDCTRPRDNQCFNGNHASENHRCVVDGGYKP